MLTCLLLLVSDSSARFAQLAPLGETLWLEVLRYFSAQGDVCASEIQQLLDLIEKSEALPPILVVDALASGPSTTLAVCQVCPLCP